MLFSLITVLPLLVTLIEARAVDPKPRNVQLLQDITQIQTYWGQVSLVFLHPPTCPVRVVGGIADRGSTSRMPILPLLTLAWKILVYLMGAATSKHPSLSYSLVCPADVVQGKYISCIDTGRGILLVQMKMRSTMIDSQRRLPR